MSLSLGLQPQLGGRTLIQRAIASLRARGSDAHLWLPGGDVRTYGPELVVNGVIGVVGTATAATFNTSTGEGSVTRVALSDQSYVQYGSLLSNGLYRLTISCQTGSIVVRSGVASGTQFAAIAAGQNLTVFGNADSSGRITITHTTSAGSSTFTVESFTEITSITPTITNGLTTGNYLESTGNTVATVDNPCGLVLDALGSVSATELVTNGGFASSGTDWTASGGVTFAVGSASFVNTTTNTDNLFQFLPLSAGKTYHVTIAGTGIVNYRVDSADSAVQITLPATVNPYKASVTGARVQVYNVSGSAAVITSISVREVTGIHLTQGTTQNKPLLRRGLTNLLTYSSDLSNAAWVAEGSAVKTGNSISTPSTGSDVYKSTVVQAGSTYTLAFELSGSGTTSIFCYNPTNNIHAAVRVTLTSTPTVYVTTTTPTVTGEAIYFGRRAGDTATAVTFHAGGLFQGTLTASQILAAGGIPVTTTAAASNPDSGRYSWAFDGSNDSLALGSVPFQMGDDFAVVAGVRSATPTAWATIFSIAGASANPRIKLFMNNSSGVFSAYLRDDSGNVVNPSGATDYRNTPAVVTLCKRGSNIYLRVNKVQVVTASTSSLGTTTFSASAIGIDAFGGDAFVGAMYFITANKGTFSDADLALEESLAASAAGITI